MNKTVITTLLAVLLLANPCSAFFDQIGMSISVGGLSDHSVGHSDSSHDFYWHSVGLFGQRNFTSKWYGDFESDVGYMYWIGKNGEKGDHALSLETRLIIMRNVWKHLHLGVGGGLCLLSDSHNHPGLGENGLYGLITAKARIPFDKGYGLDIEADHISGVVDEDSGRNVIKARIYFAF